MPVDFSHPNAQPFLLEAGDCALLLIHGFTGSPGHMRPVGEAVHAAGFTVRGIALPGHCQSIEAMEQSDWKQWLACCRDAMRQMQAKYRRVSVGGLSMGGILSLLMAEEFSPASVVLFAPALKYKRAANKLSPLAKHFIRVLDWGEPNRGLDFLNEYDYGYRGAPGAQGGGHDAPADHGAQRPARRDLPGPGDSVAPRRERPPRHAGNHHARGVLAGQGNLLGRPLRPCVHHRARQGVRQRARD